MVYVFLATGFEEIEAVAPLDILRKSGVDVTTVAVGENKVVSGNVRIPITADIMDNELDFSTISAVIIPGGYGGAKRLAKSGVVLKAVRYCYENGGVVGAICAGPSVLAKAGILSGKTITCYPGVEEWFKEVDVKVLSDCVVKDGKIITAIGPGAALEFGYTLVSELLEKKSSDVLKKSMCYALCAGVCK